MGIQTIQYIGYGYLVDYKTMSNQLDQKLTPEQRDAFDHRYHDSAFNLSITEINGCSLISDHYGGEFAFFGTIFDKSTDYPLNTQRIPDVSSDVKCHVHNEMFSVFGTDFSATPDIFILTTYR